jgi:hypothetical protein
MKERPILFSSPMVQAILAGRKTQTRRIVKIPAAVDSVTGVGFSAMTPDNMASVRGFDKTDVHFETFIKIPYGEVGDRLWVRETWRKLPHNTSTGYPYEYRATAEQDGIPIESPWKPSIHMPRIASRITLEITGIMVERLKDISEADAIAEGIERDKDGWKHYAPNTPADALVGLPTPCESYRTLWESINGPESWDSNPYVWVISFKKL